MKKGYPFMISTSPWETEVLMKLFEEDTWSVGKAGGKENFGRSFCIQSIARIPAFLTSRIEQA